MMFDAIRDHCLALPETTESFPFGDDTLVFKVAGKMFALIGLERLPRFVNLKCDPEYAIELREQYEGITPGYHMHKKQWNSVLLDGSVPSTLVHSLVDDSYRLVVAGLKKADRERVRAQLDDA